MRNNELDFDYGRTYNLLESRQLSQWRIYPKDKSIFFNRKANDFLTIHVCPEPIMFKKHTFLTQEHLYKYLMYYGNKKITNFILHCKTAQDVKDVCTQILYKNAKCNQVFWENRGLCQKFAAILKCKYNKSIQERLLETGDKYLVHLGYFPSRQEGFPPKLCLSPTFGKQPIDMFTVALIDDKTYEGLNVDGRIWMEIRAALRNNTFDEMVEKYTNKIIELFNMSKTKKHSA